MAAHSSVPAWRIPGTGEPGGLPSVGSHRVGQDGSDLAAAAAGHSPSLVLLVPLHAHFLGVGDVYDSTSDTRSNFAHVSVSCSYRWL